MRTFIEAWSQSFNDTKFPRSFYFNSLKAVLHADRPESLAEGIVNLLHWKDGKVRQHSNGDLNVGGESYAVQPCKPNTYNPATHLNILFSNAFFQWAISLRDIQSFDPRYIRDLQSKRFELWKDGSIIIPSFVLHIINPSHYPLFDQHVLRAMRALCNQTSMVVCTEQPTIQSYSEYQPFWRQLINDLDLEGLSLKQIKQVDEALWSFGKWLKQMLSNVKPATGVRKTPGPVTKSDTFTPDHQFKLEVMALVNTGTKQKEAMQAVAAKRGVSLPPSYIKYPGSHIDRWRKKGY